MELKDILAISGQPGLYKFVAQSKSGIIVESLTDGKRSNASASAKVSAMSEIAIYTDTDEKPLSQVFEIIFAATDGKETVNGSKSSSEELKKKFAEFLPDYDRERVHVSDMKKVFNWYNVLVAAGMTKFTSEEEPEAVEETIQDADMADKKTPVRSATAKTSKAKAADSKAPAKKAPVAKASAAKVPARKAPTKK